MSNVSCSAMHQLLVNASSQTETWRPISTYLSYYLPSLRLDFSIQQDEGTTQLTTSNPIAIAVRVSRYTIFSPCVIKSSPVNNVKFCQSVRLMRLSIWYRPCSISTHWYYFPPIPYTICTLNSSCCSAIRFDYQSRRVQNSAQKFKGCITLYFWCI